MMANLTDGEIRAATVAALLGKTDAGDRVNASRMVPSGSVDGNGDIIADQFPFLLVYIVKERKKWISASRSAFTATTTVGVEIHALVALGTLLTEDALDAAIDPIRAQVEDALLASEWSDLLNVNTVGIDIRLGNPSGNPSGGREVLALWTCDGDHYKEYYRDVSDAPTLDTIAGSVHLPTAANLPVVVDLT